MTDSELLQRIATDLAENTKQTALLTQAIMGNGVKGINERLCDMEAWRDSHPRECQAPALVKKIEELERAPGKAAHNTLAEVRRTLLALAIGAAVTLVGLGIYHYVETIPYNPAAQVKSNGAP